MALNGTGIEFGKSEHVFTCGISRATTTSADFIVLGQWGGVQVVGRKVGHMSRPPPVLTREFSHTRLGRGGETAARQERHEDGNALSGGAAAPRGARARGEDAGKENENHKNTSARDQRAQSRGAYNILVKLRVAKKTAHTWYSH
jgi:hypothetical protein